MEAFVHYDQQFAARWYDTAYAPHDPMWRSLPPHDQFGYTVPIVAVTSNDTHESSSKKERLCDAGTKCQKVGPGTSIPIAPVNFTCGAHLFEPIILLPKDKRAISTILARLQGLHAFQKCQILMVRTTTSVFTVLFQIRTIVVRHHVVRSICFSFDHSSSSSGPFC
jgi:hypothetical protein